MTATGLPELPSDDGNGEFYWEVRRDNVSEDDDDRNYKVDVTVCLCKDITSGVCVYDTETFTIRAEHVSNLIEKKLYDAASNILTRWKFAEAVDKYVGKYPPQTLIRPM